MFEWVGFLASILVAISITIKGGVYFRILNMAGSACFLVYGALIGSLPVALINAYCIGINIFHLVRLKSSGKQ
ncbi:MAG: YgjV family protein [Spirochaetes bacterium]|nr:YgjV family protein [Spirochaetota bacterium]